MRPGVVIVAYGAAELLDRTLAPLVDVPVVVIDNSSSSAVAAAAARAGADYMDSQVNVGFAAGVNRGVRELFERYGERDVLVLNPDAVLLETELQILHDALHESPRIAAVGPVLWGGNQPQRSAWPWPSPGHMLREALGLLGRAGHTEDFLVGASLMISHEAWRDIGSFDERFFLYAEETDWQRRAVARGWRVQLVPHARAEHAGAGTSTDPARRERLFHAGTETYIRKWFGSSGWLGYRSAALLGALLRSPLPGARGSAARLRVGIYARGPRRSAGLDR